MSENIKARRLEAQLHATITFTAHCTDAVTYKEWQVSAIPEFNYI